MDTAQQSTPASTLDQRTRVLLEAPVLPTLLKLAAPNMLVMLAQMSIGLVEVYFVAHLGVDALAGASLVFPVLSLISALSQGAVGGGVVTAIARALGRGQHARANQLVWHAVAIAAFFGLLTSAVILSAGPLFGPLGRSSDFSGWAMRFTASGKGRGAWDGRLPAVSSARRSRSPVVLPRSGSEQTSITSSWP